jgi:hypothetical protein
MQRRWQGPPRAALILPGHGWHLPPAPNPAGFPPSPAQAGPGILLPPPAGYPPVQIRSMLFSGRGRRTGPAFRMRYPSTVTERNRNSVEHSLQTHHPHPEGRLSLHAAFARGNGISGCSCKPADLGAGKVKNTFPTPPGGTHRLVGDAPIALGRPGVATCQVKNLDGATDLCAAGA